VPAMVVRDADVYAHLGELQAQALAAEAAMIGGNPFAPIGKAYQGASLSKQMKNWLPGNRSGDSMLTADWNLLTARVGDLIRNEPSLGAGKTALVKHIIGPGIHTFADVIDGEGEYIDDFNDESDEWFERWSDEECDIEDRHAWPEMEWQVMDQTIEQGEAILLECIDTRPGRSVPYALQLLEAHQLDEQKNELPRDGSNRISRGVELDKFNRAVAYWIYDAHPYDQAAGWSTMSTRIPAERVNHFYLPMPQSATRGISWFHALIRATRDVDWYLGSELTSAALGALLTAIHYTDLRPGLAGGIGLADGQEDSDNFGNPFTKLSAGTIAKVQKGDEVKLLESARPGRQVGPFMQLMRQEQAMGMKLSYITHTGDFSKTSFTSAHGAANEENAYFRPLQGRVARRVVRPIRRQHTRFAVAYGRYRTLSATQYRDQPFRWNRLLSQGPGRDQLNPLDQSGASIDKMRSGLSTLADECAALGKNWRKELRMKARVEREAARLGTTLDWSRGGGPQASQFAAAEAANPSDEPPGPFTVEGD